MRIGLLECADVTGRFPGIEGGYREMFAALLRPHLPQLEFEFFRAYRNELPEAPDECDAWISTGSGYSVYDDLDWIKRLAAFLRDLRDEHKPFVGICFGHQMLAHALGGEVAKARQGWGAGVLEVNVLRRERWMEPPLARLHFHHMHQDQVQRLPEGATLLASSPHCEVAMFRVGESMLGIEAHPEFPRAFSEALIRARRQTMGEERAERALASLAQPTDGAAAGAWIAAFIRSIS
jgi:GMP synthase-like glutamine amidotransferase